MKTFQKLLRCVIVMELESSGTDSTYSNRNLVYLNGVWLKRETIFFKKKEIQ
jgi:hypothetical protein